MLISKIAKVCHECTIYYKLIMVKFSNTNITYLNQIFQSNENNDKEKRSSDGLQLRLATKINNLKRQF